ncbi:hypothetical protein XU18_3140 [Perkinsela sp. CCAP 1560/4]|nr:hypothetical protein XU18_3814 [Perkinsela sp. CCAP 1560/4]KNH05978.1 hypothetical protein XU18_3140 [Perkinsela sp. CCAP 1560/4]|eukprot:KNH05086.1 hypothetical protein XU18_3814 [Perkinsela sp. CCAP 1560/4]
MNPIVPRGASRSLPGAAPAVVRRAVKVARAPVPVAARVTPRGHRAPVEEAAAGVAARGARPRRDARRAALDSDPSLTSQQLQVLFHSLSKVLFIFRSRYLFAIGLPMIFSLGRGIPAVRTAFPSSTTPQTPGRAGARARTRGYHPLWRSFPGRLWCTRRPPRRPHYSTTRLRRFGLGFSRFARRY